MADFAQFLRLYREGFSSLPLHEFLGIRLHRTRPPVTVEMDLDERARGLGHRLHGGAVATLVDVASCIAAVQARRTPDFETLRTAEVTVRYLAPPGSGPIRARAEVLSVGDRVVRVGGVVLDGGAQEVAQSEFVAVFGPAGDPGPDQDHRAGE